MKRNYNTPSLRIVKLQIRHQMICTSLSLNEGTKSFDASLSRGSNFDDEDDYEE